MPYQVQPSFTDLPGKFNEFYADRVIKCLTDKSKIHLCLATLLSISDQFCFMNLFADLYVQNVKKTKPQLLLFLLDRTTIILQYSILYGISQDNLSFFPSLISIKPTLAVKGGFRDLGDWKKQIILRYSKTKTFFICYKNVQEIAGIVTF